MGRGAWTSEEDEALRKAVDELSCSKCSAVFRADCECATFSKRATWNEVAESVPGRTSGACQGRWCSVLDPCLQADEWTSSEERALLESYANEDTDTWQKRARALSAPGKRRSGAHVAAKYFKLKKKRKK